MRCVGWFYLELNGCRLVISHYKTTVIQPTVGHPGVAGGGIAPAGSIPDAGHWKPEKMTRDAVRVNIGNQEPRRALGTRRLSMPTRSPRCRSPTMDDWSSLSLVSNTRGRPAYNRHPAYPFGPAAPRTLTPDFRQGSNGEVTVHLHPAARRLRCTPRRPKPRYRIPRFWGYTATVHSDAAGRAATQIAGVTAITLNPVLLFGGSASAHFGAEFNFGAELDLATTGNARTWASEPARIRDSRRLHSCRHCSVGNPGVCVGRLCYGGRCLVRCPPGLSIPVTKEEFLEWMDQPRLGRRYTTTTV
ncbi:hypothetical protein B0H17DRAFT_1259666 [Mycena rosella]|uniref:Uncharacterized protein n=1 Tax=Mycena rosella TaxID=1033263 RepID=A0AAD7CW20_MYCRO|nr:hypothetical protein B0H17DRAFT_1259666 [Mycena rosella]